jgi:hypothetical protein
MSYAFGNGTASVKTPDGKWLKIGEVDDVHIDHDYAAHSSDAERALWHSIQNPSLPNKLIMVSNPGSFSSIVDELDKHLSHSASWLMADRFATKLARLMLRDSRTKKPGKYRHLLRRTS